RTSGSTAAPTTTSANRTRTSQRSSGQHASRIASSSCAGATTGPSGAVTRRARISRRRGGSSRVARRFGLAPLVVVAAVAATGWLYALRPGIPGPRIGEALPLDELSRHSSAPLAWFVLVWLTVAALLGLYARWALIDRLTAALLLGLAVGAFTYVETAVSIAVVRQVSLRDAL